MCNTSTVDNEREMHDVFYFSSNIFTHVLRSKISWISTTDTTDLFPEATPQDQFIPTFSEGNWPRRLSLVNKKDSGPFAEELFTSKGRLPPRHASSSADGSSSQLCCRELSYLEVIRSQKCCLFPLVNTITLHVAWCFTSNTKQSNSSKALDWRELSVRVEEFRTQKDPATKRSFDCFCARETFQ